MASENPIKEAEKEIKKEAKKVKKEIDEFEEEAESFLEKTIPLKVKHVVFGLLLIILMCASFYIGRYGFAAPAQDDIQVQEPQATVVEADIDTAATTEAAAEPEPEPEPECTSHSDCDEGYECVNLECVEKEEAEDDTNTTATPAVPTPATAEMLETYNKVELQILELNHDWKETWGKIEGMKVKIVNKESVAVGPGTITMTVEGYGDDPEVIQVPSQMQVIPKGYSATRTINVPYGFSYNPISMGIDADSVEVEFKLKDEDGTIMDTVTKTYDLT